MTNHNDDALQCVADLSERHVGQHVSILGLPTAVLHSIEHSNHGYVTVVLGNHTITVNESTPVTVGTEEVRGQ